MVGVHPRRDAGLDPLRHGMDENVPTWRTPESDAGARIEFVESDRCEITVPKMFYCVDMWSSFVPFVMCDTRVCYGSDLSPD